MNATDARKDGGTPCLDSLAPGVHPEMRPPQTRPPQISDVDLSKMKWGDVTGAPRRARPALRPHERAFRTLASLGDTLASRLISGDPWVKDAERCIRRTL